MPLYAEATIRPEGSQADAVSSLVERVVGSTAPLDQLPSKLDELMANAGLALTYEDDIAPWIGHRAAIFVRSFEPATPSGVPDLAIEIEADDVDAAKTFLDDAIGPAIAQEQSYSGVDYFSVNSENLDVGVVSDAVVFGTDAAFKLAVDTSHGESLASSSEYTDRVSSLPDDPLATVFADPGAVIEAIAAANPGFARDLTMLKPVLAGPLSSPIAATLTVSDASAAIDLATTVAGADGITEESPALADLPGDAWFAAALPGLGPVLSRTFDELKLGGVPGADQLEARLRRATGLDLRDDVLSWLQGVAGFVSGTSQRDLKVAVIANSDDPEAPHDVVDALRRLAEDELGSRAGPAPEGADYGFTVGRPDLSVGEVGDQLIGAFRASIDEALHPAATLGENESYSGADAALGDDFVPLAHARLPDFFAVAEKGGTDFGAAKPYLDALGYLILGARIDDDLVIARLVVGLQ